MSVFQVRFTTAVDVVVSEINADDDEEAVDVALERAEEYLRTVVGEWTRGVSVSVSLDGVGPYEVTEVSL
jgi:riboflavin synthase